MKSHPTIRFSLLCAVTLAGVLGVATGQRAQADEKLPAWAFVTRPPNQGTAKSSTVYQLKITLLGTKPPIWRRIETKDVTLAELHELIQTSMGWTNSHLHQFEIAGKRYSDPRLIDDALGSGEIDYSDIHISDLISEHGAKLKMLYEYDFGDGWEHAVVLEKLKDAEPRQKYPRCTDGKRACPPEDIGGMYGFADYLEAIADPAHDMHDDYLESTGPFDPDAFDPAGATRAMRKGLPAW